LDNDFVGNTGEQSFDTDNIVSKSSNSTISADVAFNDEGNHQGKDLFLLIV
jgi:hypothetical protein